jgi:hypothetical protein
VLQRCCCADAALRVKLHQLLQQVQALRGGLQAEATAVATALENDQASLVCWHVTASESLLASRNT